MNYKNIGVIVADKDEYVPFVRAAAKFSPSPCNFYGREGIAFNMGNAKITTIFCSVGKVNAAAAAMYLVKEGCDLLLNFGLSGTTDNAQRGGMFLPDRFIEHDFDLSALGYKPCEKPGQKYIYKSCAEVSAVFEKTLGIESGGTAVSGDSFICDADTALKLKNLFDARFCDMETAAIAAVCDMCSVPFCALRKVSDGADDSGIEDYRDMNSDNTGLADSFIQCLLNLAAQNNEPKER